MPWGVAGPHRGAHQYRADSRAYGRHQDLGVGTRSCRCPSLPICPDVHPPWAPATGARVRTGCMSDRALLPPGNGTLRIDQASSLFLLYGVPLKRKEDPLRAFLDRAVVSLPTSSPGTTTRWGVRPRPRLRGIRWQYSEPGSPTIRKGGSWRNEIEQWRSN